MDSQRLPLPRVPSPIREPDSLVVTPSTQPRANTTGEDSEAQQPRLQLQIGTTPPHSTSTAHLSSGSVEKQEENDPFATPERQASVHGTGIDAPLPSARLAGEYQSSRRARTIDTHASMARRSVIDHIVPTVEEKPPRRLSVRERIQPTIDVAQTEKAKFESKARMTGYALNTAIGLQVLLGSLTTGLSAVAASSGKQTAVSTTILGALATLVASYLARARGSNEPELSISRTKDLEQFIRQCEVMKMDHGHEMGGKFDSELERLRARFEELLGNTGDSQRKLAPV